MILQTGNLKSSKKSVSNRLILGFFFLIVFFGAFSEFFQRPRSSGQSLLPYRQLFRSEQLDSVRKIVLTNGLGTFRLEKNNLRRPNFWQLTHPRPLTADREIVEKILSALREIKILKIYPKDSITMANYSLNTPMITLKLIDTMGHQTTLKIGLVNPIDNSTYIAVSDREALFHVEKINLSMGTLTLTDLIDSTVFPLPLEDIAKFHIYRGSPKRRNLSLSVQRKDGNWVNRQNKLLDRERIRIFFKKIRELKSLFILDKAGGRLTKEIKRYSARPLYTLKFYGHKNDTYTYTVTNILPKLTDVKMESGQNFLITSSDGGYPQLVDKNYLKLFNISERNFKRD